MMARAKNIRLRMSEITQEGIDRALKRVDGLDHKIQKIEDPGDKEVFMVRYYVKQEQQFRLIMNDYNSINTKFQAELESIKSEVRDIMVECRQVSNDHKQAILEYQEEMKNCLALLAKATPPQPK